MVFELMANKKQIFYSRHEIGNDFLERVLKYMGGGGDW